VPALDAQVAAEVTSALVRVIDDAETAPTDLRQSLAALDVPNDSPQAFGRSIAFSPTGERRGAVLGYVMAVRPGRPAVLGYALGPDGQWSSAVPINPVPVAVRQ
jgi:hypothetical protein